MEEIKLCKCGCGRKTSYSRKNNRFSDYVKCHNRKGKKCSIETKLIHSINAKIGVTGMKGKHQSDEMKSKLRKIRLGKNIEEIFGTERAEVIRAKYKSRIGSFRGKHLSERAKRLIGIKQKIFRTGTKHKKETIEKMKNTAFERYLKNGQCLSIGKKENELLDLQEQKDNCKILRQYRIPNLRYIVDGYCPETNTVYEVYEPAHSKNAEIVQKDLSRETEICNKLSCDFIILWS